MSKTVASKLISLFITPLIVTSYFIFTYSDDIYFSLFFPSYFLIYSFCFFVSIPISIVTSRVLRKTRSSALKIIFLLVIGSLCYGVTVFVLAVLGLNITRTLFYYGWNIVFVFLLLEYFVMFMEKKVRRMNPHDSELRIAN
ncbi:MAG: hypothetical protein P0Y55_12845 [Candidatus Cohnella colombiensis]|uniref:Uncharacterized protein n=1 Tax=Candidatus Cohnella colombiensis TaxID=3121368 RepID=A0AA95F2C7_9BACL|nr:MAG: hypothetical protein P0Y55_12845 [Cohnella sp.]